MAQFHGRVLAAYRPDGENNLTVDDSAKAIGKGSCVGGGFCNDLANIFACGATHQTVAKAHCCCPGTFLTWEADQKFSITDERDCCGRNPTYYGEKKAAEMFTEVDGEIYWYFKQLQATAGDDEDQSDDKRWVSVIMAKTDEDIEFNGEDLVKVTTNLLKFNKDMFSKKATKVSVLMDFKKWADDNKWAGENGIKEFKKITQSDIDKVDNNDELKKFLETLKQGKLINIVSNAESCLKGWQWGALIGGLLIAVLVAVLLLKKFRRSQLRVEEVAAEEYDDSASSAEEEAMSAQLVLPICAVAMAVAVLMRRFQRKTARVVNAIELETAFHGRA